MSCLALPWTSRFPAGARDRNRRKLDSNPGVAIFGLA
jgi:hypothetical protein